MPINALMNVSNASFNNVSIGFLNVSNITTTSIDTVSAGTMNIGKNASTINIGTSGTNVSILSKAISLASPLTLGTTPTGSTQLGWIISGTIGTVIGTPASVAIPIAGIWLFTYNITYNVTGTTSWASSQLSGTNVPLILFPYSYINSANAISTCGSIVVNATASTYTVTFYGSSSGYTVSTGYSYLQAVRIA
jgi:hypothetical protein